MVGSIRFQITDLRTGVETAGERQLTDADIVAEYVPPLGLFQRIKAFIRHPDVGLIKQTGLTTTACELSGEYQLKVATFKEAHRLGFALTASSSAEPVFCWEWFCIEGPGMAKKLQETGRLQFNGVNGIQRVDFATDVDLRLFSKLQPTDMTQLTKIRIFAGSWIELQETD